MKRLIILLIPLLVCGCQRSYTETIEIKPTITTTTVTTTKTTTTKKKTTKKKANGFNIKASKSEMQEYAKQLVIQKWGEEHWEAFNNIVIRESGWNPNSINKKSGACGLFQFVPCSKGGKSYKTSYKVQIQKGIEYISARYDTPQKAWAFWQKHHWN